MVRSMTGRCRGSPTGPDTTGHAGTTVSHDSFTLRVPDDTIKGRVAQSAHDWKRAMIYEDIAAAVAVALFIWLVPVRRNGIPGLRGRG